MRTLHMDSENKTKRNRQTKKEKILTFIDKTLTVIFYSMALKPINIRWIITGSNPY